MPDDYLTPGRRFSALLNRGVPQAVAWISGYSGSPQPGGSVKFYDTGYEGVLVEAELFGLPNISKEGASDFYAMHIHQYGDCSNGFKNTGEHYNPTMQPHPQHAGDMPPLLSNQGYAWTAFYDKRFSIKDIIGKSVVIHSYKDDFTSQPSGNSGIKIGCGVIRAN